MTEIAEIRRNFWKLARMIPGPAACRRFYERVLTDPGFEAFSKYLPSMLYVGSTKRELSDAVSTPWQSRSSLIQANSWALPLTPFPIRRKAITASSRVIVVVGGVGS
jgi:hypothetical protein